MDVVAALRKRSSIRAFRPDPVPDDVLRRVLDAAREAPSWKNVQPYRLAVATGALTETLRGEMLHAIDTSAPRGDFPMINEYPSPLKERARATGYGLYGVLGIQREDQERRGEQFRKNWAFFGAPVVMFLFVHEFLKDWGVLDAGIFLDALLLSATEQGLGTIPQAALGTFPDIVRKHFTVPAEYKLLCGISMGYVDTSDVVNTFRPKRLEVDEILVEPLPWTKKA